jgi:hypothetical protein
VSVKTVNPEHEPNKDEIDLFMACSSTFFGEPAKKQYWNTVCKKREYA